MKIHEKSEREKTTGGERERSFTMSMAIIIEFLDSDERDPLLVRRDPLLYKLCQIDKIRKSCSVWIPKFLILLRVEPNTPIWIDIGESPSRSCGSCLAADKDKLPLGGHYLIWIKIEFKDRDFCNRIWFFRPLSDPFEIRTWWRHRVKCFGSSHSSHIRHRLNGHVSQSWEG